VLRGYAGNSGETDLCIRTDDGAGVTCNHCTITAGVDVPCTHTATVTAAATVGGTIAVGNAPYYYGTETHPEIRAYVGFAQATKASTAGPYFATTTAAVGYSPTGAKGEPLTFTRASVATCTKTASGGLATTGIADGDLVSLPSGYSRVEYGAAGTLGLLVETTRTNSILRSEELDNAAWTLNASAGKLGTRTANFAVAPDGTTTADRLELPAVTAPAEYSRILQNFTSAGGSGTCSVFVKGNGTSGSFPMYLLTGFPAATATCTYGATTWSRCTLSGTFTGAGENLYLGPSGAGTATTPAQDVLVWGAQCEIGAYATSYIPTTSAAVARATDVATFTVPASVWASTGSAAFSWTPSGAGVGVGVLAFGASGRVLYGAGTSVLAYDGTNNPSTSSSGVAGSLKRYWSSWSTAGGWVVRNETSGNQATSAFTVGTWTTDTSLETTVAGLIPDGIMSRICMDPDSTRCR
jgi:hypothetical protein